MDKTEQNKNFQQGMKTRAQNHARKLRQEEDHRKGLGSWMGMTSAARKALQDMDRLDKELAAMGAILLLSVLMASGQGIPVVVNTNQIPRGIQVDWRTNLYEAEMMTFVSTNWLPVGPPVDIVTNGVVIARRQFEAATLLTNVFHRLTFGGVERQFIVSQTTGPVLATRSYDFPPKLDTPPFLAAPLRQQR